MSGFLMAESFTARIIKKLKRKSPELITSLRCQIPYPEEEAEAIVALIGGDEGQESCWWSAI